MIRKLNESNSLSDFRGNSRDGNFNSLIKERSIRRVE